MKLLIRCGFAALILASVAIQVTRGQRFDAGGDPWAALAVELGRLNIRTEASAASDILTGRVATCAQPIRVTLLRIDGAEDERLRDFRPAEETGRYVYLGAVAEHRGELAMNARWMWASVLFTIGLRHERPPTQLVFLGLPRACPDLVALRWSRLSPWDQ